MKKLISYLPVVVMLLFLQSCYYEELPSDEGPLPTNISYSQDVQGIFNLHCVSCHNGGAIPLNLTSGNSFNELINGGYVIPSNANSSNLVQSLRGDGQALMPPNGSISNTDINKVIQWINEGALNN